ncbi:MAG: bacteriochlorophyll 4-vinyl reductase [Geminicoccaceae bacterium]|nr:bacteriochlorophyll 4-vinyl reductase [Geminicoccaceae bacterium]
MSEPPAERADRIGPNAILQVIAAVRERGGEGAVAALLRRAGLEARLARPIEGLVPVAEVRALHAALIELAGLASARNIAADAGRRTAAYLLAHRIPRFFQRLLAVLPRPLRQRLLLATIARHAWTFTGGGSFRLEPGAPPGLVIDPCPLCPDRGRDGLGCVYYAATFDALLRRLVDPRTNVEPAACGAAGSRHCALRIERLSA